MNSIFSYAVLISTTILLTTYSTSAQAEFLKCTHLFEDLVIEEISIGGEMDIQRTERLLTTQDIEIIDHKDSPQNTPEIYSGDRNFVAKITDGKLNIRARLGNKSHEPLFELTDYRGFFVKNQTLWVMNKNPDMIYIWNFTQRADRVLKVLIPEDATLDSVEFRDGTNPNMFFQKYLAITFRIDDPINGAVLITFKYNPYTHEKMGDPEMKVPTIHLDRSDRLDWNLDD